MPLYPFQKEIVEFLLANGASKLVCAEAGVGKTAPTCVALSKMAKRHHRVLIICPPNTNVTATWEENLAKWANTKRVQVLKTGKDQIGPLCTYIICPYPRLYKPAIRAQIRAKQWDVMVLDEAHKYSNWEAEIAKHLYKGADSLLSCATYRWLLSGSFMPNRVSQMFLPLKCLAADKLGKYAEFMAFTRQFCGGYFDKNKQEWNYHGSSNLPQLQKILEGIMFFRRFRDVHPDIPPDYVEEHFLDVDIKESERDTPLPVLERLVGIAKIQGIMDYLTNLLYNKDEKILVFTRNRTVTEQIHKRLNDSGFKAGIYYGGMSHSAKQAAISRFVKGDGRVLVANRMSLGEGTNTLQFVCNRAVDAQPDWSAGLTNQSYGRLIRHGQTKPVYLTRIIARNTPDERIWASYAQKMTVINTLFKEKDMTIEALLTEANGYLKVIADAVNSKKAEVVAEKKPASKPQPKPPTEKEMAEQDSALVEEDVREVASLLRESLGGKKVPAAAKTVAAIIKKFAPKGSEGKLADVPSSKYEAAVKALKAAMPEGEDPEDEDEEEDEDDEV